MVAVAGPADPSMFYMSSTRDNDKLCRVMQGSASKCFSSSPSSGLSETLGTSASLTPPV